jgi:hypothetical protein
MSTVQHTLSTLINIYYDLYDYYKNEEYVINAIYHIMKRNNRHKIKSLIRTDLTDLNLKKYTSCLVELSSYSNERLDYFKLDSIANLDNIICNLEIIEYNKNSITLDRKKLERIIKLCQKLHP